MTKQVHRSHSYPASLEQVSAMLRDASFREEVCREQGARDFTVEVSGNDQLTTVTVSQEQEAREIPASAAKLIGDAIRIEQVEQWTAPSAADVRITTAKMPVEIHGTMMLTEEGGATTQTVDLTITAKLPLIGGKLEDMVAGLLDGALRVEQRVGEGYLAR